MQFLMNWPKFRMNSRRRRRIPALFLQVPMFSTTFAGKRTGIIMTHHPFIHLRRLLLAFALLLSLQAAAQMESRLTYRRYTTQDGLPQMQTEKIWQDARGYIYIGTLSGFVRFDGRTFTPFLKGRRYNIVGFIETGGKVRALDFRRQWLISFDEVEMQPIDPAWHVLLNNFNSGSLPSDYVLLEDEQEENRRLCRVTPEGFQPVVKGKLLDRMTPDRKMYLDSTTLYVPTEDGLWVVNQGDGSMIQSGITRPVPLIRRAVRLSSRPDFFTLLRTGKELLAFARDGIYTVGTQGLRLKTAFHFKAPDYGIIARRLQDGRLVLADLHTLYEYDGNELRELASGINLIKDVMIDRWDRLWMATYQGLYCFFNRGFTNHRLADKDDIVRALAVDGNDRLVMGSLNGKLMAGGKLIEDNPDNFYAPNSVTIDGKVYMAGKDDVACYADGNLHRLGLPPDRYQFVSKAGNRLIIGSRKCIAAYHPESGAVDTLSTEIPHPWCAAEDAQGRLWVGSTFGLFADGRQYDYAQKLIVTTMERDAQGNILLASKDSLFMIRHGQVSPLAMPELAGHEVRSLHVSPKGYLVVAVIDGLFVSRFGQDYNIADTRFFDHNNGFTALEPLMAMMAETSDGTVWLAGVEEMSSFSPERLLDYRPENTFIAPPLRWWQHWWVALLAVVLLSMAVWVMARWIEKRRNRKRLIRLEREKEEKARQISAIRKKAIEAVEEERLRAGAATGVLARDIVRMTEATDDTRLVMRTVNGTMLMNAADIAYFKADGNYSQMVSFQKTEIIITGLGKLEKTLNPQIFVRADRSTLVNIHNISHLNAKSRTCTFRSADNIEVETTLLAPAFKRLEAML